MQVNDAKLDIGEIYLSLLGIWFTDPYPTAKSGEKMAKISQYWSKNCQNWPKFVQKWQRVSKSVWITFKILLMPKSAEYTFKILLLVSTTTGQELPAAATIRSSDFKQKTTWKTKTTSKMKTISKMETTLIIRTK